VSVSGSGLATILAPGGRRARRSRAPGSLVAGSFRWSGLDRWTQAWWPQGIAVGDFEGVPLALVSWFGTRGARGARLTVLNLSTLRYRHVALVGASGTAPVAIHAGGIAWSGDRLLVAATFGGIREFRLSGIRAMPGGRFVLPQVAHREPAERFRYSFLAEGSGGLVGGEYSTSAEGRLASLGLSAGAVSVTGIHVPGVPEMQGAVFVDGRWAVSSSRGDRTNGDLWLGAQGELVKQQGALPPGPEDLAWWPARRQLWGVSEHPGQRWVYAVDLPY
jgi:hypothetical protein